MGSGLSTEVISRHKINAVLFSSVLVAISILLAPRLSAAQGQRNDPSSKAFIEWIRFLDITERLGAKETDITEEEKAFVRERRESFQKAFQAIQAAAEKGEPSGLLPNEEALSEAVLVQGIMSQRNEFLRTMQMTSVRSAVEEGQKLAWPEFRDLAEASVGLGREGVAMANGVKLAVEGNVMVVLTAAHVAAAFFPQTSGREGKLLVIGDRYQEESEGGRFQRVIHRDVPARVRFLDAVCDVAFLEIELPERSLLAQPPRLSISLDPLRVGQRVVALPFIETRLNGNVARMENSPHWFLVDRIERKDTISDMSKFLARPGVSGTAVFSYSVDKGWRLAGVTRSASTPDPGKKDASVRDPYFDIGQLEKDFVAMRDLQETGIISLQKLLSWADVQSSEEVDEALRHGRLAEKKDYVERWGSFLSQEMHRIDETLQTPKPDLNQVTGDLVMALGLLNWSGALPGDYKEELFSQLLSGTYPDSATKKYPALFAHLAIQGLSQLPDRKFIEKIEARSGLKWVLPVVEREQDFLRGRKPGFGYKIYRTSDGRLQLSIEEPELLEQVMARMEKTPLPNDRISDPEYARSVIRNYYANSKEYKDVMALLNALILRNKFSRSPALLQPLVGSLSAILFEDVPSEFKAAIASDPKAHETFEWVKESAANLLLQIAVWTEFDGIDETIRRITRMVELGELGEAQKEALSRIAKIRAERGVVVSANAARAERPPSSTDPPKRSRRRSKPVAPKTKPPFLTEFVIYTEKGSEVMLLEREDRADWYRRWKNDGLISGFSVVEFDASTRNLEELGKLLKSKMSTEGILFVNTHGAEDLLGDFYSDAFFLQLRPQAPRAGLTVYDSSCMSAVRSSFWQSAVGPDGYVVTLIRRGESNTPLNDVDILAALVERRVQPGQTVMTPGGQEFVFLWGGADLSQIEDRERILRYQFVEHKLAGQRALEADPRELLGKKAVAHMEGGGTVVGAITNVRLDDQFHVTHIQLSRPRKKPVFGKDDFFSRWLRIRSLDKLRTNLLPAVGGRLAPSGPVISEEFSEFVQEEIYKAFEEHALEYENRVPGSSRGFSDDERANIVIKVTPGKGFFLSHVKGYEGSFGVEFPRIDLPNSVETKDFVSILTRDLFEKGHVFEAGSCCYEISSSKELEPEDRTLVIVVDHFKKTLSLVEGRYAWHLTNHTDIDVESRTLRGPNLPPLPPEVLIKFYDRTEGLDVLYLREVPVSEQSQRTFVLRGPAERALREFVQSHTPGGDKPRKPRSGLPSVAIAEAVIGDLVAPNGPEVEAFRKKAIEEGRRRGVPVRVEVVRPGTKGLMGYERAAVPVSPRRDGKLEVVVLLVARGPNGEVERSAMAEEWPKFLKAVRKPTQSRKDTRGWEETVTQMAKVVLDPKTDLKKLKEVERNNVQEIAGLKEAIASLRENVAPDSDVFRAYEQELKTREALGKTIEQVRQAKMGAIVGLKPKPMQRAQIPVGERMANNVVGGVGVMGGKLLYNLDKAMTEGDGHALEKVLEAISPQAQMELLEFSVNAEAAGFVHDVLGELATTATYRGSQWAVDAGANRLLTGLIKNLPVPVFNPVVREALTLWVGTMLPQMYRGLPIQGTRATAGVGTFLLASSGSHLIRAALAATFQTMTGVEAATFMQNPLALAVGFYITLKLEEIIRAKAMPWVDWVVAAKGIPHLYEGLSQARDRFSEQFLGLNQPWVYDLTRGGAISNVHEKYADYRTLLTEPMWEEHHKFVAPIKRNIERFFAGLATIENWSRGIRATPMVGYYMAKEIQDLTWAYTHAKERLEKEVGKELSEYEVYAEEDSEGHYRYRTWVRQWIDKEHQRMIRADEEYLARSFHSHTDKITELAQQQMGSLELQRKAMEARQSGTYEKFQKDHSSHWVPRNITDNVYAEMLWLQEMQKKEAEAAQGKEIKDKAKGPKNVPEAIGNSLRYLGRELAGHIKVLDQYNRPKDLYPEIAIEQAGYGMICPLGEMGRCLLLPQALKQTLPLRMQHLTPQVEELVKRATGKLIYYDPASFRRRVQQANQKHRQDLIIEAEALQRRPIVY